MTLLAPHQGPPLMTFDPVADERERLEPIAAELRVFLAGVASAVAAARDAAGDLWWVIPTAKDDLSPAEQELHDLRSHIRHLVAAASIIEGVTGAAGEGR